MPVCPTFQPYDFTPTVRRLVSAIMLWLILAGCSMSPYDREDVDALINGPDPPVFDSYSAMGRRMHYASVGAEEKRPVIFIHGTPGSWEAFAIYLSDARLRRNAHLVAVDRIGFGKSASEKVVTSLQTQAALLLPLVRMTTARKGALLVGHSLGAPIAVRMAMDFPELIDGLLLVAPSLDPALEEPRWYNRLADWALISWLVPEPLRRANREVMPLAEELRLMLPYWKAVDVPVVVIQGMQDKLVAPENADFARRMLGRRAKILRLPQAGHFVLWNQPEVVADQIVSLLKSLNAIEDPTPTVQD